MTLREKLHAQIDRLDEAVLSDALRDLKCLEERFNKDFPSEFLNTVREVKEHNKNKAPSDLQKKIDDAVQAVRDQNR